VNIGRVFENGVLREILGLKRDEVTGDWRRAACCVLTKYHLSDRIKKNEMGWTCNVYGG